MGGFWYWLMDKIFFPECQAEPKPGDLIEIFRSVYRHWAVYVGLGYIVHLVSPGGFSGPLSFGATRAMVKKERLSKVAGTDYYRINNKYDSTYTVRSPDQIVRMAEKLVGQKLKYKLTVQNCEHFANSLRYNVARGDQVLDKALLAMATALLLLLACL